MRQKLAAGNWKMNGTAAALAEVDALNSHSSIAAVDVVICPPATLLSRMSERLTHSSIETGGQDCHPAASGAHTGDVSAAMLVDAGAAYVILGHSERREDHGETSALVCAKAGAAMNAGLTAIICVGESETQRDDGTTLTVIEDQLAGSIPDVVTARNLVIAYEPIWAIGTGRVPTLSQIEEVHDFIRTNLITRFGEKTGAATRILYGGSVKPSNAAEIFHVVNVDGALVGGASLKANDFSAIITALAASA
ncbi:triose-phosphate isomerase [Pseudohalocynthiibacter aestuariivivens]|jgi:triosephosphate isomerase (TIM)|uniref:Triosephosphate isomerase n=1 Tax=Pseudohalocynthiibacter aestuariivivens TaxID=1591409 RepID=A0ABV5JIW6_9RHOB|nr:MULTISPECIES: triose-phosphate isomerase [Pseudohalocynthiibacter]MBS9716624.1 triose-phosphate isomerase [Pseudohalocynthiibacter aestuariivivens]MCK0101706.1 triose-phosphate isomerase [Pseudohalocynthiibacter sp. F2068]